MYTALFETVQVLFVNTDYTMGCKTTNLYLQVKLEASINTIMWKGKFLIAMATHISTNDVLKRSYSTTCKNQDSEYSFIHLFALILQDWTRQLSTIQSFWISSEPVQLQTNNATSILHIQATVLSIWCIIVNIQPLI
jgi:Ni,Fe-hydrogenase I cytochrome b subunit